MLEIKKDLGPELKLNRRDNILVDLQSKREQLQRLLAAGKANEFGTHDSVEDANELQTEIKKLEIELKSLD